MTPLHQHGEEGRRLLVAGFALVRVGLLHELQPADAIAHVVQARAFGGQDQDRLEVHNGFLQHEDSRIDGTSHSRLMAGAWQTDGSVDGNA